MTDKEALNYIWDKTVLQSPLHKAKWSSKNIEGVKTYAKREATRKAKKESFAQKAEQLRFGIS